MIKLELNKEYTWREICELIGFTYSTKGQTQKKQLEELKQYVEIVDNGKTRKAKRYIVKSLFDQKLMRKNFQYNNINNNIKIFSHKKNGSNKNINLNLSIEEYPDYKEADWNLVELSNYVKYTNNYIDSFSAICRLLNIKYTTDPRTRKKILDYLGNFFEIEKCKKGRGFIVTNIISTNYIPMIKQGKYDDSITELLIDYFLRTGRQSNYLYKHDVFCILDFCSPEYREYIDKQSVVAKETDTDPLQVEDYYNTSFKRMNDIVQDLILPMNLRCILL